MSKDLVKVSKFLSYVLRHRPDEIGLTLDEFGWADIDELLECCKPKYDLTFEDLEHIIATEEKPRYWIDRDNWRIKATHGHSLSVKMDIMPETPPAILYHGTATRSVSSIVAEGLKPMSRIYVHLTTDETIAKSTGARHGEPVVLVLDTEKMHRDGFIFYHPDAATWLVDRVPSEYLMTDNFGMINEIRDNKEKYQKCS